MVSLVRRTLDRSPAWPTLFRLCAVLWLAVLVDMGLGLVYSLRDFHTPAQAWAAAGAGGPLTAGLQLAAVLLAALAVVFLCWHLFLLRRRAAVLLSAMSWYGLLMLLLEVRTPIAYLLSTVAVLLTVASICGWRYLCGDT